MSNVFRYQKGKRRSTTTNKYNREPPVVGKQHKRRWGKPTEIQTNSSKEENQGKELISKGTKKRKRKKGEIKMPAKKHYFKQNITFKLFQERNGANCPGIKSAPPKRCGEV